jgi:hypothetical protein
MGQLAAQLALHLQPMVKDQVAAALNDKIRAGMQSMDALRDAPADNKDRKHDTPAPGLASRAGANLDAIALGKKPSKSVSTPAAVKSKAAVKVPSSSDEESGSGSDRDEKRVYRANDTGAEAVDRDAALEERTISRLKVHALEFRKLHKTLERCYELKESQFDAQVWHGIRFAARVIDQLLDELGPKAEDLQAYETALRRIAALELAHTTGDWKAADQLQAGTRSATLLHVSDMRRYHKQSTDLRSAKKGAANNKSGQSNYNNKGGKSGRSGGGSSDKDGKTHPSDGYFGRRFGRGRRGGRSNSRGGKSPAGNKSNNNKDKAPPKDGAAAQ